MLKKSIQLASCLLVICLFACAMPMLQKSDEGEMILTPSRASVSPSMDFDKIRAAAVFPLFPGTGMASWSGVSTPYFTPSGGESIEDPAFAEQVCQALSSELMVKQSQWKIYSYNEVVEKIFKKDLGRGYKNFQADFNTASGQMQAFILTQESKRFLKELAAEMKVDAFIFGSYNLSYGTTIVQVPLLGARAQKTYQCSVNIVLYQTNKEQIWWQATDNKRSNDKNKLISSISKSLASYVGKGTLQRL